MKEFLAALLVPIVCYNGWLGYQFLTGAVYVDPSRHGPGSYIWAALFFLIAYSAFKSILALLDID